VFEEADSESVGVGVLDEDGLSESECDGLSESVGDGLNEREGEGISESVDEGLSERYEEGVANSLGEEGVNVLVRVKAGEEVCSVPIGLLILEGEDVDGVSDKNVLNPVLLGVLVTTWIVLDGLLVTEPI